MSDMTVQTPWEQGGTWATPEEEAAYLAAVEAALPPVTVEVIGMSTMWDRPIHQATITTAPPNAPVILIVGGQHGYEPMGREAVLQLIRDAATWEIINRVRLVCIPTASPQSAVLNARNTPTPSGTVDMNRDHFRMVTMEARILQQAITILDPVMVIDCHEWANEGDEPAEVWTKSPDMAAADDEIKMLGAEMDQAVRNALDDVGIPSGPYPQSTTPSIFSNGISLRSIVALLIETRRARTPEVRAHVYHETLKAALDWADLNTGRLVATSAAARTRKAAEGAARTSPFDLGAVLLDPPPAGYIDLASWPSQLDIFGIYGDTSMVTMAQPGQPLIPFLLDSASAYSIVEATRYSPPPPPPGPTPDYEIGGTPSRIRVPYLGVTVDVEAVRVGTDMGTVTVWERATP